MKEDLIKNLRQNHALEHATVSLLTQKLGFAERILGTSTFDGFYIYGNIPSEEVRGAVTEALARLQGGDHDLAISPFCGTTAVVAGALAGVACFLALGDKNRSRRLPLAILAATGAIIAAQPIGRAAQKYVTTSADLAGVSIRRITRRGTAPRTLHKIETARD
jgi:hypothetical protein